jgi:Na+/H+ antiporter NhaC
MESYGFLSLVPPLIAISLAIITRQVIVSLLIGIFSGWLIVGNFNILSGIILSIEGIVNVFSDPGSTRVVIFTFLVGSLIAFIQVSGGVDGFIESVKNNFNTSENKISGSRKKAQIFASITGISLFVESNISALTVGTIYRPIFDKLKISREKLAYIADSTSAPSKLLIPFNGWGAFIMGLLITQGLEYPFQELVSAMKYNFYPILVIVLLFYMIVFGKDFGPMKKAELRARKGIKFSDGSTPMVSEEITVLKAKKGVKINSLNMFIPLVTMVISMLLMLFYTGYSANLEDKSFFGIIKNASGSSSVLYSVIISLLISSIYYISNKILTGRETINYLIKGMSGMMQLSILILLAFAVGNLCNELGTGIYVSNSIKNIISPELIPFLLFITSCFISFSTGTSWGTFAIMIAIAIPISNELGINPSMAIAASLGGGVFGDHCSPISDSSVVSSMASASDHIDHVKTQIPYAGLCGIASAIIYLILGYYNY